MEQVRKLINSNIKEDRLIGYHLLAHNYTITEIFGFCEELGKNVILHVGDCDVIYYDKEKDTILFCGKKIAKMWTHTQSKITSRLQNYNLAFSDKFSSTRIQIEFKK